MLDVKGGKNGFITVTVDLDDKYVYYKHKCNDAGLVFFRMLKNEEEDREGFIAFEMWTYNKWSGPYNLMDVNANTLLNTEQIVEKYQISLPTKSAYEARGNN